MRGRDEILEILDAIDSRLVHLGVKVDAYMIGGGNMALRGLKGTTKDIDLVIPIGKSKHKFLDVLSKPPLPGLLIASRIFTTSFVNTPVWIVEFPDSGRLDIFGEKIGPIRFSKNMATRAEKIEKFTKKTFKAFRVKLISIEDLILTKLITSLERERDEDDIRLLLPFADHNIISEEMRWQLKNA